MRGRERCLHLFERAQRHGQRGIGPRVLQMHLAMRLDPPVPDALRDECGTRICLELRRSAGKMRHHPWVKRALDGALALHTLIGEPHSVRGQHSCQRVDQHGAHAEFFGYETGVLSTRAAEALEREVCDVVAFLERHLLDRVCHVGHRNAQKPRRSRARIQCHAALGLHLRCERCKALADDASVDRHVAPRAEDRGKVARLNLADADIGIGHGQRTAAPVAGRPRIRACAFGADAKARAVKAQN